MNKINFAITLFVLLAASSTNVLANDGKNYSPLGCYAEYNADKLKSVFTGGELINTSHDDSVTVVCPVTKEIIHGKIQFAWVEVKDRSNEQDVSCWLYSYANGVGRQSGFLTSQHRKTVGMSNNIQKLSFSSSASLPNGAYSIRCTLPKYDPQGGYSSMSTYNVSEI